MVNTPTLPMLLSLILSNWVYLHSRNGQRSQTKRQKHVSKSVVKISKQKLTMNGAHVKVKANDAFKYAAFLSWCNSFLRILDT